MFCVYCKYWECSWCDRRRWTRNHWNFWMNTSVSCTINDEFLHWS